MVADALDSIPDELARAARERRGDRPGLADRGSSSTVGRGTLLGLYEGIDLTRRSPLGYAGVMPDRITIFRGPLCALARDEDDLARAGARHRAARGRSLLRVVRRRGCTSWVGRETLRRVDARRRSARHRRGDHRTAARARRQPRGLLDDDPVGPVRDGARRRAARRRGGRARSRPRCAEPASRLDLGLAVRPIGELGPDAGARARTAWCRSTAPIIPGSCTGSSRCSPTRRSTSPTSRPGSSATPTTRSTRWCSRSCCPPDLARRGAARRRSATLATEVGVDATMRTADADVL